MFILSILSVHECRGGTTLPVLSWELKYSPCFVCRDFAALDEYRPYFNFSLKKATVRCQANRAASKS